MNLFWPSGSCIHSSTLSLMCGILMNPPSELSHHEPLIQIISPLETRAMQYLSGLGPLVQQQILLHWKIIHFQCVLSLYFQFNRFLLWEYVLRPSSPEWILSYIQASYFRCPLTQFNSVKLVSLWCVAYAFVRLSWFVNCMFYCCSLALW